MHRKAAPAEGWGQGTPRKLGNLPLVSPHSASLFQQAPHPSPGCSGDNMLPLGRDRAALRGPVGQRRQLKPCHLQQAKPPSLPIPAESAGSALQPAS